MHMRAVEHTINRGSCTHHAAWVNHTEDRCLLNRGPQVCAFHLLGVVVTASNNVPGPTDGIGDPALPRPEERSGQHGASDLGIPCFRIGCKSLDHRFERFTRFCAVLPFEYLPGDRQGRVENLTNVPPPAMWL